jgi:MerR family mercuric resistance operon transcriptional regulator
MEQQFTIGELARAASVPTSTVRYYERVGILQPAGRTDGNYRVYGEAALERLQFIRAAQATGFTLDDITSLLPLQAGIPAACKKVQGLIRERLTEVRKRMDDLRRVEQVLESALGKCERSEPTGHCETLDKLIQCSCCPPAPEPSATRKKPRQNRS